MKNTDQRQLTSDYAPYEAFWEGFVDYRHGLHRNPYDAVPTQDVECQAWDRGQESRHARDAGNRERITDKAAGEACHGGGGIEGVVTTQAFHDR